MDLDIGKQIYDFTEQVSEGAMLCKSGVESYLKGNFEALRASITCIKDTEKRGEMLRRSIEQDICLKTLNPKSRSDVVQLLEGMDLLIMQFRDLVSQLDIESPEICGGFHADFKRLLEYSIEAVEADIRSCRACFSNIHSFTDHIHKVTFWNRQSRDVSIRLQRAVFAQGDLTLSQKMHLCSFAKQIEGIAEDAESVADRLKRYISKRTG
ncbi:MAG: DUF47 family protein [Deltaproteobacteria bacterium]|nr:DUF47 family protein [Deltaproteobacteria bacterium]